MCRTFTCVACPHGHVALDRPSRSGSVRPDWAVKEKDPIYKAIFRGSIGTVSGLDHGDERESSPPHHRRSSAGHGVERVGWKEIVRNSEDPLASLHCRIESTHTSEGETAQATPPAQSTNAT